MKINIKNFGPILDFSFDLSKEFHLIVGENNVGKSYSITLIYLIIKSFIDVSENFPLFLGRYDLFSEGTDADKEFLNKVKLLELKGELSATSFFEDSTTDLLSLLAKSLTDSFSNTFQSFESLTNEFNNEALSIELAGDSFTAILGVTEKEVIIQNLVLKQTFTIKHLIRKLKTKATANQITIYYTKSSTDSFLEEISQLKLTIIRSVLTEVTDIVKNVHYLPASRSGLYQALSAFGQIIAEFSKKRAFLKTKVELPSISEPLSDYFIKLSEISPNKKKDITNNPTNKIAERIEQEILKGSVEFDSKHKQLMFKPDNTDLELELSSTSSMVSELSPIVSYLRYVLNSSPKRNFFKRELSKDAKSLVFIEEPEAHLHPEIQIKLMEIFAELVQEDIKLVITSHSNYIFHKANNAIIGKQISHSDLEATVFHMTSVGSIGKKLEVDDLGIEDDNFLEASENLFEEKLDLLEEVED